MAFKRLECISAYLVVEVREEEKEGGHVDDQHVLHPHREVTANPEHHKVPHSTSKFLISKEFRRDGVQSHI